MSQQQHPPHDKHSHPMSKSADHGGQPYTGALAVDATPCKSFLLDLPPGATRGLKHAQPGIDGVLAELQAAMPAYGAGAGVPAQAWADVQDATAKLASLAPIAVLAQKLAEVCEETSIVLQDRRQHAISQIADAVRSTAKHQKSPEVEAPFEKTIAYASQAANKAVKTRQEHEAQKAAPAAAPAKPQG
jgi:hypothetical protein